MKENKKKIIMIFISLLSLFVIIFTIYMITKNVSGGIFNHNLKIDLKYQIPLYLGTLMLSLSILALLINIKNRDKLIIYILSSIILFTIFNIVSYQGINYLIRKDIPSNSNEKDKVTLDESNVVSDKNINLNNYNTDLTITEEGTYTLTGTLNHSVIIDAADKDVNLILNNVNIVTTKTATIIGMSANKITITLADESENTLSDGGNSSYDGCIFSNSELEFNGTGYLTINGNQTEGEGIATEAKGITFNGGTYIITSKDDGINAGGAGETITINDGTFYIDASGDGIDSNKDATINGGTIYVMGSDIGGDSGIDTDDGYAINGGTIVALGSDMIETPISSSKQNTIAFTLDSAISKDTLVTLTNEDGDVIVSFKADKNFITLIISSSKLVNGTYYLYTGGTNNGKLSYGIYQNNKYSEGTKIEINNVSEFTVSKTVNLYGNKGR